MEYSDNVCCQSFSTCPILSWQNPKLTGMILGMINLVFITMFITELNVFTFAAYLLLFYVLAGIVIGKFSSSVEKDDNEYEHVSKDKVEAVLKRVYSSLICCDQFLKKVISLSDLRLTIKFYIGLFVFMTLTEWFCECFLIWLALNLLFLWKPLYTAKKDTIIGVYESSKQTVEGILNSIDLIIPRYKDSTLKTD